MVNWREISCTPKSKRSCLMQVHRQGVRGGKLPGYAVDSWLDIVYPSESKCRPVFSLVSPSGRDICCVNVTWKIATWRNEPTWSIYR